MKRSVPAFIPWPLLSLKRLNSSESPILPAMSLLSPTQVLSELPKGRRVEWERTKRIHRRWPYWFFLIHLMKSLILKAISNRGGDGSQIPRSYRTN